MADLDSHSNHELEDLGEGLRRELAEFRDTTSSLIGRSKKALSREELRDVADTHGQLDMPVDKVTDVMSWAARLLLLGGGVASAVGYWLLGPMLGLFLNRFGAGLLAFVGLPLYELYAAFRAEEDGLAEIDVRFQLLCLSLGQGLLTGFALSNCHLSTQPVLCLTPVVVAYTFPAILSLLRGERRNLAVSCGAVAFGVNIVLGWAIGLMTAPYLFLSTAYALFTAAVLQHMVHNVHGVEDSIQLYPVVLSSGLLVIKAAAFGIFGITSDELKYYELYAQ